MDNTSKGPNQKEYISEKEEKKDQHETEKEARRLYTKRKALKRAKQKMIKASRKTNRRK